MDVCCLQGANANFPLSFLETSLFSGLILARTLIEKHPSGIAQQAKWKHVAATLWKMVAPIFGTTLEIHKATASMVVTKICEAVVVLMRPRGE